MEVEPILAALGVEPFLRDTPARILNVHLRAATEMGDTAYGIIRDSVADKGFAPVPTMPPFDYDAVRDMVAQDTTLDIMTQRAADIDSDLMEELAPHIGRVLEYLKLKLPSVTIKTLTGDKPAEPSDTAVARFRRTWRVANRPLSVLEDMAAGIVTRNQVRDLVAMYPQLAQATQDMLVEELALAKARDPDISFSWPKEQAYRIFLENPKFGPGSEAFLEQVAQAQPPEAPRPRARPMGSEIAKQTATETEKREIG